MPNHYSGGHPSTPFNRAKLFNAGFSIASKDDYYDCFFFSDVDLTPLDEKTPLECIPNPRHYSGIVKIMSETAINTVDGPLFCTLFCRGPFSRFLLLRKGKKGYSRISEGTLTKISDKAFLSDSFFYKAEKCLLIFIYNMFLIMFRISKTLHIHYFI